MLSNTFIVSEFVEILYSFPTWSCVKICHTVPRPVQPSNVIRGCATVCRIVMLHWSWYRMAHCHVALVVVPYDAGFNNISVISWRSVLLVEETGLSGENHRPVASHWQTLSHNVVSSTLRLGEIRTDNISGCLYAMISSRHVTGLN
jgi:hypothetical protein